MTATRPELAKIVEGLTEPQRQAVERIEGPVLVLAGPGSGKTTVVTRRVANIVAQGIPPWQILALTFTNKAAAEMRRRVDQLVPAGLPGRRGLTITTFHAFCARLLRVYGDAAGIGPRFSIYDADDQRDAIKQALREAELSDRNFAPSAVLAAISAAKNRLLDSAGFAAEASDFFGRQIARAFAAYERILRKAGALDFDDLLVATARLLRRDEPVCRDLSDRFQYILVDEYQDTNHAQFVIAGALAERHRNICVVGDPDQSIYGWRGADLRNILDFETRYPEAAVIPLGRNFRSTGHIVRVADALIRHNTARKHKTLHTELGDGARPEVVVCRDEWHEAAVITDALRRRHVADDVPWKEMAVLCRVNALTRVIEDALRDARIPYVIARGTAFYERREVKDALAYLRLVVNPADEMALRRVVNVPARGIGKTSIDRFELHAVRAGVPLVEAMRAGAGAPAVPARAAVAARRLVASIDAWRAAARGPGPLAPLVERVIRESGLEALHRDGRDEESAQRCENVIELINAAAQFADDVEGGATSLEISGGAAPAPEASPPTVAAQLAAFLEAVALVSDADAVDPENGAVTLLTLHAAKGLEFDVVAMAGLEAGLLPHARANESEAEMEEERRLCFVGITRARRHLLITRAKMRTRRGISERTAASRFLDEIPRPEIVFSDQAGDDGAWPGAAEMEPAGGRRWRREGDDAGLPPGTLVEHPTFGVGRVESVTRRAIGASARVRFETVGTKTLILEYAGLRRLE
jgi:DNA helicase-2/ATP-dependent DNA helicase PcrA